MKMKSAFTALFVLSLSANVFSAQAHGPAKEKTQAEKEAASKTTAIEDFKSLQDTMTNISNALKEKNLKGIHDLTDKSTLLIKAMETKATPPAEKKARLESALKQLTSQIDKVHLAADANDQEKSEAEFKKAEGALRLVEANLK